MINIFNGSDQEIEYYLNKESALQAIVMHIFTEGELLVVGYYTEGSSEEEKITDIITALGIGNGNGPENYRILTDQQILVVTSVLDYVPDVSAVSLNQRYVVKDKTTGKIWYLCRYSSSETGQIEIKKTEIKDKLIVHDASTGEIWFINPPNIVNYFDSVLKPGFSDIIEINGDLTVKVESNGKIYDDLHFINSEEKNYLISKLFESNFRTNITYQKYNSSGEIINSYDPCEITKTIYTLTANYSGEKVILDSIPEGWTLDEENKVYTKEVLGNITSSSGSPICIYTRGTYTGQKTASSVTSIVKKYFFILYSDIAVPNVDEINRSGIPYLVSSPKGTYTIEPRDGLYTWFCFPTSMEPSGITQLGVSFVSPETTRINNVTYKNNVNLGTFTLYHSLNTGNGLPQEITIN